MSLITETHLGLRTLRDYTVESYKHLQEIMKKQKQYKKTIRELENLSERELNDLGLSRAGIRQAAYEVVYKNKV